ncbi:MAG: hypothetical protein LQ350_001769 [Teloschistes chrysophthalmus]|nr:MAG: hypothetical protein LQ350_001769 [Niorma chrysophthalma]
MLYHYSGSIVALALFFTLFGPIAAVKHENFKTCEQSGFCKRNRAYADKVTAGGSSWTSPYTLDPKTISVKKGQLTGVILKTLGGGTESIRLPLTIAFLDSGVARVTVDEEKRQKGDIELRHGSQARKERYNGAQDWAIVGGLTLNQAVSSKTENGRTIVPFGPNDSFKAVVKHAPFSIDFMRGDDTQIQFNGDGLLNMEHWRPKVDRVQKEGEPAPPEPTEDEETWWEESFGGNTDSKVRGPESIGLDITFPGYEHVYGIPEHASSLSLKQTRGGSGAYEQPYRLYNSDVFEYEMDSPMTLYGAIPLMQAHRKDSTVGVFWLNAAETWVDIVKTKRSSNPLSLGIGGTTDTHTHWFSENGLLDVFVFLGPTPKDIIQPYNELTGYTQLPQHFALGYHQCRWNYVTDEDVKDVDRKFDKARIPYDVIWLDIEYTDGKKYFTWDKDNFPDPLGMQKHLDDNGRKLVIIVDPHIKNEANYPVVDALKAQNFAVVNKDNNIFEGWCWPGSSYWPDTFNPAVVKWWKSLFTYSSFQGVASNAFLWNDMNEPSVFNGPETTMPKDNLHFGGWEHRDVHNINGLTFVNATYEALLARDDPKHQRRPFVLTRSFYAGSQRVGAMWTGDNLAAWDHLEASIPMILNQAISGFSFSGADVGGFFGNPSKELLTRWYQAGAFYPFFRAHAHIDSRRREPYLAGVPYTEPITQALRLRYTLLPAWYTAFHTASTTGEPVVRPMWYVHPSDEAGFALDDQFYVGDTGLLVKPVLKENVEHVDIYLPPTNEVYYDYFSYEPHTAKGSSIRLNAPLLGHTPVLMRGGNILARKDRPRKSSALMKHDPYTLVVALDNNLSAEGALYIDDGESFEFQSGHFVHRRFRIAPVSPSSPSSPSPNLKLESLDLHPQPTHKNTLAFLKSIKDIRIEKIIVVGAPKSWESKKEVSVKEEEGGKGGERKVGLLWKDGGKEGGRRWAVVRDPGVGVGTGWSVEF